MKHVLCFGDSNTHGYIPGGGRYDESIRWTKQLQKLLGEDYLVIEEGLNGRTCVFDDPVEGGFKSGAQYLPVVLKSHKPLDLVIIMLGTNDTKERFGLNAQTIGDAMENLIRLCMMYGEDSAQHCPRVLIVSPAPIRDDLMDHEMGLSFGYGAIEKSKGLAAVYKRLADRYSIDFFDAGKYVETSEIDSIHLAPESHRVLGTKLAEKVRAILEV